jgi:epoxyqueuosine reductase
MISTRKNQQIQHEIIKLAKLYGATMAGIARIEDLKSTRSYEIYPNDPYYAGFEAFSKWSADTRSILVFGVEHNKKYPELDWWDPKSGDSPGHQILKDVQTKIKICLLERFGVNSISLPNKIGNAGIFLKDSSALAGIGIIGKNNLLLTPTYGPRVRLRATSLDVELEPTNPLEFDPCSRCDRICFRACPQNAFRDGTYERKYCQIQMQIDEANERTICGDPETKHVRYCRACELSCPVGY